MAKTFITEDNLQNIANNLHLGNNAPSERAMSIQGNPVGPSINNQDKIVTPTEFKQYITADAGYTGLGTVAVNAISSTYIGSSVTKKTAATIMPSTKNQEIPTNTYLIGKQTILGDTDLIADNIKSGVQIFGVTGSYVGEALNLQEKEISPNETQQEVMPDNDYNGLSKVTVNAISNTYVGSGITRRSSSNLTTSGATVTVPAGYYAEAASKSVATATQATPTVTINKTTGVVTGSATQTAGYVAAGTKSGTLNLTTVNGSTITPTESEQTAVAADRYTLGAVKIGAISSTYIGSDIDIDPTPTVSGAVVTIPTGYYSEDTTKSVATTTHPNPTVSINTTTGLITASHAQTAGYVNAGTTTKTSQLTTKVATTITPTESEQTAVNANVYTLGAIKVGAISSTYVGSGVTQRSGTDLTASGATVTVPAGYYAEQGTKSVSTMTLPTSTTASATSGYASKATVSRSTSDQYINIPTGYNSAGGYYKINATPNGTAGTPTASKGAVSNHIITVIPSVSNTTGYITGGTINGTGVSVAASELVSGTKSINENGTNIDVTNYAKVNVSVSAPTPSLETVAKTYTPTESTQIESITAGSGYDGIEQVDITINPISSTYIGSGVERRTNSDLIASGKTITVPAGYYNTQATKDVSTMTLPTAVSSSATSGYTSKISAGVGRSASDQYINIPPGYNESGGYYKINAVANGSVTAPSSISGSSATVSTGTNTLTLTKSVSVTPNVTTAGYISAGTAGNSSVSLTASINTRSSSDLTANGATITAPAGYYAKAATKSVASGSATGPTNLSGSSASISTGTNTLTLTKTGVTTTPTVSAGYVSNATASTATVALTASVTTKAAATITPGTTNQTIASGTYLTGTQTISGDADLTAANIKQGVQIFNVTGTYTSDATAAADDIVSGETAYVNGSKITGSLVINNYYTGSTAPSASLGSNGDIYIQE